MENEIIMQRISKILSYINHPIINVLEKNLRIFNTKELTQILEFLESWSLNSLEQFLEDKKKEYLIIIQTIKLKKRITNLENIKTKELEEQTKEKKDLELINFNF